MRGRVILVITRILLATATVLTAVAVAAAVRRPLGADAFVLAGALVLAVVLVAAVSIPLVGAAAARAQPHNSVGWLLLVSGVALPLTMAAHSLRLADPHISLWIQWLDGWPATPAADVVPLLALQLYPDGRPLTARWRWLLWLGAGVFAAQLLGALFAPTLWEQGAPNPTALPGAAGRFAASLTGSIVLVPPIATLSALVATLRWRRGHALDPSVPAVPIGLAAVAGWLVAASWWLCVVVTLATGDSEAALIPELLGLLAVAVAAWIGIHRYGLFEVRTVVSRGLVAIALGVCVLAIYLALAWAVSRLAAPWLGGAVAVLVAVAAALPLWRALQTAVDRLLFGDRGDPTRGLRRLSGRIASAVTPEELLPDALRAVTEALRLPAAQLRVGALVVGELADDASADEFPLVFAGERIGDLRAAHRAPGEGFTPSERAALMDLATQLAGAARAVALGADLRTSRERLVTAREDERRRMSRDLHDGLGARLGGLVLGLQRARVLAHRDPERADEQLSELTAQVRDALAEVRRLVYALRPPALDELGLVGAVREHAHRLPAVQLVASPQLGTLPAAVEVAAYRIAIEALTNVERHTMTAPATVCITRSRLGDGEGLVVEVSDRGPGLPAGFRAGVGITSMRERAFELDGEFSIGRSPEGGTVVRALLPLGEAP